MLRPTSFSRRFESIRAGGRAGIVLGVSAALILSETPAAGQTFGLDDLPAAPLVGPLGPIGGLGAEDPFALVGPPLAPSPSLGFLGPNGDGAWLSPGPVVQLVGPNGFYVDSFSGNHLDLGSNLLLDFSVDRVTVGQPAPFGVGTQAALGQAHGDIFTSTEVFAAPGGFAGTLGPGPFAGFLPPPVGGTTGNNLTVDESAFGLLTPSGVVGPGVPVPAPLTSPGQHDNVDSFDHMVTFDPDGDTRFNFDTYFTLYPDEAVATGLSAADIIVVANGDTTAIAAAYAPAFTMGLDAFDDSIDALVMYDNNNLPIPVGVPGAPGSVEPFLDYALFSLAPGSLSLQLYGLSPSDVLYTDFSGAFAVYALTQGLGLVPSPGGQPFNSDNIDALEVTPITVTSQFSLRDGGCVYDLFNVTGNRIGGGAGLANLFSGANDHVFQNWFWYRGGSDTREYALANQVFFGTLFTNHARLVYSEPLADGTIPNALLFDLEYTLSDLSTLPTGAAPPACVRCEIVIAISVRNLTPGPVQLDLFSYNDMDLNASGAGDFAVIAGIDNQVQLIDDPGPGVTNCTVAGVYKVSSTDHVAWEIAPFPSIRNALDDAVPSVLNSVSSPFGPADYSGAQQWTLTLGPAGSVVSAPFDSWSGTVVKEIVVYLPGDADGDCQTSLTDLAIVLSTFGAGCTP